MDTIQYRHYDPAAAVKSFNRVAWFYDGWSRLTEAKALTEVLELSKVKDKANVIEVACGTGVLFEQIVRKNPDGVNVGFDISPDMLKKARNRLLKAGLTNFHLESGDVMEMNFPPDSFELLINTFMMDLMPEDSFGKLFSEYSRILKPGGTMVVSYFSFGNRNIHKFWTWLAKNFPGMLTGCRPVKLEEPIRQAGFTISNHLTISQNTFPSEVIRAVKPMKQGH